jgi:hypothetical protein
MSTAVSFAKHVDVCVQRPSDPNPWSGDWYRDGDSSAAQELLAIVDGHTVLTRDNILLPPD